VYLWSFCFLVERTLKTCCSKRALKWTLRTVTIGGLAVRDSAKQGRKIFLAKFGVRLRPQQ
jgi:hypothetical protein